MWLTSKNRKKHQRRINRYMRLLNENIKNDELWKGRFYIRQQSADWVSYVDHSGNELYVRLLLVDKLTGQTALIGDTVNHYNMYNGGHLWHEMNKFIVETCAVWEKEPRPGTVEYKEMTEKYALEGWPNE